MAIQHVNSNSLVTCWIHQTKIPRAAAHEHHEAPRAAGGSDDVENLVWLCATCHQVAHRATQLLAAGKSGAASDLAYAQYAVPADRHRFASVVKEMVKAHEDAALTGIGKPEAEVMIYLDHELYGYLKALASDHRSGNRKVGVGKYIAAVLRKHAAANGYVEKGKRSW